ncbi:unnamed protein product [Meloidogyne enterolobii]|uniref:Uncharacterized protein n=1 Tax=Meloidogyne enterolobii TaxID=390850 RepID=A0ACB0Y8I6_MELEN
MNVEKLPFNNSTMDKVLWGVMGTATSIHQAFVKSNMKSTSVNPLGVYMHNCSDPNFFDVEKILREDKFEEKGK